MWRGIQKRINKPKTASYNVRYPHPRPARALPSKNTTPTQQQQLPQRTLSYPTHPPPRKPKPYLNLRHYPPSHTHILHDPSPFRFSRTQTTPTPTTTLSYYFIFSLSLSLNNEKSHHHHHHHHHVPSFLTNLTRLFPSLLGRMRFQTSRVDCDEIFTRASCGFSSTSFAFAFVPS
ncbi:hypothetical protein RIF29_41430 [Crotalaria pallida]|uniref:Uncharacterized protein n=1 Tax=Crotalaria pallida TaxID=3830 RepID=A0AAN9E5N9_CROPI